MGAVLIGLGRSPMASRLLLRATGAVLLLALLLRQVWRKERNAL